MSSKAYVKRVFVGSGTQSTIPANLGSLAQGELALVNADTGAILNAAAATALGASKFSKVQVAMGTGNGIVRLSSAIQGATVSQYSGKDNSAPVLHQLGIGYNVAAPTGVLAGGTIVAGNTYRLRIMIKDSVRINGQRQTIYDVNYFAATNNMKTAALSTLKAFYYNQYGTNYASDKVVLNLVTNGTATALTQTLTVTKGSVQIVGGVGHGLIAGDLVRIGGATAGFPVYVVESTVGTTGIVLTTPYLGNSGVVVAANCLKITAETLYGFVVTALEPGSKVNNGANDPYNDYTNILFTANFTNAKSDADPIADVSTVTVIANGDKGEGYWKQVSEDEDSAKGYLGEVSRRRFYDNKISNSVVVGTLYDKIDIVHADYHLGDMQKTMDSPLQTTIYLPTGSNQDTNTGTNFRAIINAYFVALGFPAIA